MTSYWRAALPLVLVLVASPVAAATITVTTTAQTAQPGDGCTLSDAIAAANGDVATGNCPAGAGTDTILVPAGTYTLTTPAEDDGYGDATGLPFITTPMVIEGEGADTTIIERPVDAPAFRLVRTSSPALELRGLTLRGGDARNMNGGAVFGHDFDVRCGSIPAGECAVRVTARDVTFDTNSANHGGALADLGAFYGPGVVFTLEDTRFTGNRAGSGGAINLTPRATANVARSHFTDNASTAFGGAIADLYGAAVEISDSEFLRNRSTLTGGAIHSASPRLTRVVVKDNRAQTDSGGGVYSYGGRPVIRDSTFTGNQAPRGGAIDVVAGSIDMRGSTVSENVAFLAGAGGGSGVRLDDRSQDSRISNSTFSGNVGNDHGAIALTGGTLTLTNTTVVVNAPADGGWTAGVTLGIFDTGTVRLANSIVAGNGGTGTPRDVYAGALGTVISLGHNLVGTGEFTGEAFFQPGDLVGTVAQPLDPGLLPLAANGGFTSTHALSPGSPAFEAGSRQAGGSDAACEPTDQRGRARPGAGTVACDIGAFEHQVTFPLSLTVGPGGSVTGLTGSACTGTCDAAFDSGTVVTLEAHPAGGASFVGWTGGGCSGADLTCLVTITGAQTVTATFRTESAGTNTVLTSSGPSVNGQIVTFKAVVAPVGATTAVPTGFVEFESVTDGANLGKALLDASGTASLSLPLVIGSSLSIEVTAAYAGDGQFNASAGTVLHTIQRAHTELALTSSEAAPVSGQPVTFTAVVAAVAPGAGTPTGTVTFRSTATGVTLATVPLDASGIAATTTSALPVGAQQIQASYAALASGPLPRFEPSDDAALVEVTAGATTTLLTSSSSPALSGAPLTLTATVTALAPATGVPGGRVTFVDAVTGTRLGAAEVDATGTATLKTTARPVGTRTIVASYHGDAAFAPSDDRVQQITLSLTVPLLVEEGIAVADAGGPRPSQLILLTERIAVADNFTPLRSYMLTIDERVSVADGVDPAPQGNTPSGTNVQVQPVDPATGSTPVVIRFAAIVGAGSTSAVRAPVPAPPIGFEHLVPAEAFEISTTAAYSGDVEVCIAAPADSISPRLMHFEANAWVDRTTTADLAASRVCGSVRSLSPFALFVPAPLEGRMTGQGSLDDKGLQQFEFRLAERSLGTERGALRFEVITPKAGKQKAYTQTFRATDITSITFSDDPGFRPGHRQRPLADSAVFAGVGTWNGRAGYTFTARATDHGEPGRGRDTFEITIQDPQGATVLTAGGTLTDGNIQSQRLARRR